MAKDEQSEDDESRTGFTGMELPAFRFRRILAARVWADMLQHPGKPLALWSIIIFIHPSVSPPVLSGAAKFTPAAGASTICPELTGKEIQTV